MEKCDRDYGCHVCLAVLMRLHQTIKQELSIPNANSDRIRAGYLSVKRFIEDVVGVEGERETEV